MYQNHPKPPKTFKIIQKCKFTQSIPKQCWNILKPMPKKNIQVYPNHSNCTYFTLSRLHGLFKNLRLQLVIRWLHFRRSCDQNAIHVFTTHLTNASPVMLGCMQASTQQQQNIYKQLPTYIGINRNIPTQNRNNKHETHYRAKRIQKKQAKFSQAKACFMCMRAAAATMQACFRPHEPDGCSTKIRKEGRSWWTSCSQQPWVTPGNHNCDPQFKSIQSIWI